MAENIVTHEKCLPNCSSYGPLQKFKLRGIQKLIECARERHDDYTQNRMQAIWDSQGDEASVELHKNCYCSFTSKVNVAVKKKADNSTEKDEPPITRCRRSQAREFDFKKQCLFCSEACLPMDSKHPDRWDRVIQCEKKGAGDAPPFKGVVLDYCNTRNDAWSSDVALRCNGVHDLAAAEAQYHLRCYDEFRKISAKVLQTVTIDDEHLNLVIDEMYANQKMRTWTSTELFDMYISHGGQLTRKQMFTQVLAHLADDVIVLHLDGCASIVGFRELVGKIVKVVKLDSEDEDEEDGFIRKIKTEARNIPFNNKEYDITDFTCTKMMQQTSATLLRFISKLVSRGSVTKASLSLSQSIQALITNTRNQTTLGLGVKLHHKFGSSDLIHILHQHGFIVSYDEVLRFRKSAAAYMDDNVVNLHRMLGLSRTSGIIFGWFDNFDLLVSTPNGRRETHAMATEFQVHPNAITESSNAQPAISDLVIPRLTSRQVKFLKRDKAIPLLHYSGTKNVKPPTIPSSRTSGLSYTESCARQASLIAAQDKDMQWLNTLNHGPDAMEWNGFNNQLARSTGILKSASIYMFGPLIDAPPSHPDTILTTLTYMQRTLNDMGMMYAHVSIDMQLFAVSKQVCWSKPHSLQNIICHPGGMHIMQSFIGCIAKLMKGSGLEVYVAAAYRGLTGIFNGKSWVKAMRAFRGVSAAILKRFLSTGPKTFDQMQDYIDAARLHPTGRHWVDNFLLPTLLVHQFERSEREGDFYLKLLTMERMLKYFFLAGHVQYARYLSQYLLEVNSLPAEAKSDLLSGAFVCRHHEGYWNAVSGDQFGEQTAIKMGKGGLKGMTLSAEFVSEWIDAFPIIVHLSDRLDYIYSADATRLSVQKQHTEELKHRRVLDADDRRRVDAEVEKYCHPLEDHHDQLCNPVTGELAPAEVNVADAFVIGEQMASKYMASLPDGFYNPISSPIKTMDILKKKVKCNKGLPIIDLENIFLRLLMIGQRRQMDLQSLFAYELCSVPPSLIDEHGCLRKGNKSVLVKRLGVVDFSPPIADTIIVDVSQLFYHIVWPHGGSPSDLIASITARLNHYPGAEKVVVFDKYKDVSAKDHERIRRAGEFVIDYDLSITSPLPKRDAVMKSKRNKKLLASVLGTFTIAENVTMETHEDGAFEHDEADVTMISYVLEAARCGKRVIRVLSDDTDVFILLLYWVYREQLVCKVQMERWDGTVLDINAACIKLGPRCLQLLGMHALSGCDTTSYPYGIGKATALKILLDGDFQGLSDVLGEVNATSEDVMEAAKTYVTALYGQPPGTSLEYARFSIFTTKKTSPKVTALPPTSANLLHHALRAHLQSMLWKSADQHEPPDVSSRITQFGWDFKDDIPIPVISHGHPAPPELIDMIKCNCKAQGKMCSSENCGCHKERISCTTYCYCSTVKQGCCNPFTNTVGMPEVDSTDDVEYEEAGEDGYHGDDSDSDNDNMDDEWE